MHKQQQVSKLDDGPSRNKMPTSLAYKAGQKFLDKIVWIICDKKELNEFSSFNALAS